MAYSIEDIKLSQKIFYYLLENGQLEEDSESELYRAYVEREEVMNLVKSQGEVSQCRIERYGTAIYIIPDMGNTVLGFKRQELKKRLCKSDALNRDYYLSQFVILTLLAEFYDGQGIGAKSREYIKMGEFQNIISERLKAGLEMEKMREDSYEEDFIKENYTKEGVGKEGSKKGAFMPEGMEDGYLDYKSMSEAYECLKSGDASNRARTTKEGFLNNIIKFLEEQGLVTFISGDDMIKTTEKLDNIMEMKILNKNNYARVMEAMGVDVSGQD